MPQLHRHLLQLRQATLLRLIALTATFFVVCTAISFLYLHDTGDAVLDAGVNPSAPTGEFVNSTCFTDLDVLRAYTNASAVEYGRLEVAVVSTSNFSNFSESLDLSIPAFHPIRLDTETTREGVPEGKCSTSLTIPGPVVSPPVNASHLLFGVATSIERLHDSLDAFAHWAAGTGAHILAVVDEGGSLRIRTEERATLLGLRLTIIEKWDEEVLDRYFSLVRIFLEHRDASTQWAVLIDDDTFFPSMCNLVDRLASYDSTRPQYIGALSEDMWHMYLAGHIAYGGAGVFLSLPIVERLAEVFDDCYLFKGAGDGMIGQCIYAHTDTKLTWDRHLYQLDLRGDVSGFYESGRPLPLSLHHWKSWHHANVAALGKVAAVCGAECLLRRWRLADGWYLVNGYSIIQYSRQVRDPAAMEQTWDESKYEGSDPFAYSLGPLRGRDPDKQSFRLKEAIADGPDRVRQIYLHERGETDAPRVLEVVWKRAS
ncbi:hypothetical protein P170DRAFT_435454 [Aspergillus steynii IBT 23096]|uniref:Glycosyltransferase family 31 protein n=1 Tax=Aspergillus steynii IBT 23096 TaxID=1392250 RepID=A0A2I2GBK0_9EURO|nr:uncharacterized protein P170DRAFT_435454 [Aspergillus steynii IBT 23096]PLB50254.1 hypothetical protein P170DRAFT_435454 [Aspergillus steynii IBT 23096]